MADKRQLPKLSLRATFEPNTFNAERGTVDVVWTTGARVRRGYWDKFDEELSLDPAHVRMDRLNSGAPLLAAHDSSSLDSVIGRVESAKLQKGRGVATVRFPTEGISPEADRVRNLVQDGILQNISVGYRVHKFEKVEGGDSTIPVYRAIDWEPMEISVVPIGADPGAGVRSDSGETFECVVTLSRGGEPQEQTRMAENEGGTPATPAVAPVDLDAERSAAVKAERDRVTEILTAVRSAKLSDELADKLIADRSTVDDAYRAIVRAIADRDAQEAPNPNAQHVFAASATVTDDAKDKFARGAEAWLLEKSGALSLVRRAETVDAYVQKLASTRGLGKTELGAGEFRGASLSDLARKFLELRGIRPNTFDKVELFRQAYNYRSGYATTSDFSVLFENVMYKTLLAAYETQEDVWPRFCGTKEVQDFRPANFFRTGSFGVLPALNESGEFEHTAIPDGLKSTVSVGTYGDIIAISRQAVINDDMGALADIAAQRGRDARMTIEDKVFEQLALNSNLGPTVGGVIFFSNTNANINGTAAANTATSWDLDAQIMGQQYDISGNKRLNLVPEVLLLPRAKLLEAKVLNASTVKIGGTNGEPNPAAGTARDIISTTRLSGTRRYWFANPQRNPAIVVAFLAGQGSAPTLSSEQGFNVDGTQFKTRLDFGVSFFDPKCAVTNAGA